MRSLHTLHNAQQPVKFQPLGVVQLSQLQTNASSAVIKLDQCSYMQYKMSNLLHCRKDEPPFGSEPYTIRNELVQKHVLNQKLHNISFLEHSMICNISKLALMGKHYTHVD
jgi:hypothetical protein